MSNIEGILRVGKPLAEIEVIEINGGHKIKVTDPNGVQELDIMDGKDGAKGLGIREVYQFFRSEDDGGANAFNIVMEDGTEYSFMVNNGSKGERGEQGEPGIVSYESLVEALGGEPVRREAVERMLDLKFLSAMTYSDETVSQLIITKGEDGKVYGLPILQDRGMLHPACLPYASEESAGAMSPEQYKKLENMTEGGGGGSGGSGGIGLFMSDPQGITPGNTETTYEFSASQTINEGEIRAPFLVQAYASYEYKDSKGYNYYMVTPADWSYRTYTSTNYDGSTTYRHYVKGILKEASDVNAEIRILSNLQFLPGGM